MASKNTSAVSHRVPTTVRDMFFEDPHFMDNWEDFGKVKESMFKESRDLWKKMDQDFRQMRCMKDNALLNKELETPSAIKWVSNFDWL